jgi:regulator of sigma E protease
MPYSFSDTLKIEGEGIMQQKISAIIWVILGLSLIVIVHESGHFLMCKLFDVKTPIFSVGFGPVLFSYTIHDTAFQLAALPLGGYVSIDPASIATKTYLQKLIINIAGIAFNIIFALLLIIYLSWVASRRKILSIVTEIAPHSPASDTLLFGDRIVALDSTQIDDDGLLLTQLIEQLPGQEVTLTVERNDQVYEIPIVLAHNHPVLGKHIGWLGVSFKIIHTSPSIITAVQTGITTTCRLIKKMAQALFGMWHTKQRADIMGPVGIINTTQQQPITATYMAWWLALININVALFNLLPIPLLDGGHILLDTIEALYGKPLPEKLIGTINLICMLLFLTLFVFITMRDVQRLKTKKRNQ